MDSLCAAMEFNMAACFSSFLRRSRACLASRSATAFVMISSSLLICCCFCTANFCIIVSLCLWSSLKQKEMQIQAQCWAVSKKQAVRRMIRSRQGSHTSSTQWILNQVCCENVYSLLNLLVYDTIHSMYDICINAPIKSLNRPTEDGNVNLNNLRIEMLL